MYHWLPLCLYHRHDIQLRAIIQACIGSESSKDFMCPHRTQQTNNNLEDASTNLSLHADIPFLSQSHHRIWYIYLVIAVVGTPGNCKDQCFTCASHSMTCIHGHIVHENALCDGKLKSFLQVSIIISACHWDNHASDFTIDELSPWFTHCRCRHLRQHRSRHSRAC